MEKNLKVLSLFSGCGGMDLGFEGNFQVHYKSINKDIHPEWIKERRKGIWVQLPETRFKTIFANDILPAAKASWVPFFVKYGHSENEFHLASIVDLVKRHEAGEEVFPYADVVTGGFPCQDFSVAGKRNGFFSEKGHHGGRLNDNDSPTEENRGKLYMWMKRVIECVKPKVFVAENVKGLVSLHDAKQIIENDFRNIGSGYLVVEAQVLYAPNYGVPQGRERVIFIGIKKEALKKTALKALTNQIFDQEYSPYPQQTHGSSDSPLFRKSGLKPYVTTGDYLTNLPEPEEAQDEAQKFYSKAKWYGKHCQGQTEIDLDGIGPTIRSEHHGNIEFRRLSVEHGGKHNEEFRDGRQERRLTVRECARIQTFPDYFEFVRNGAEANRFKLSPSDGYRLVGNAVPPLLAFHIAWRLQTLWPKIMK